MAEEVIENENHKHKIHNYLIVFFIFILCIGLVLYLCQLYKIEKEETERIPIIRDSLREILYSDLDHYILDNPTSVIYMCAANEDSCRTFEKKFKKLLLKKEYSEEIIYLNLTDINKEEFIKSFNEKYPYKSGLKDYYPIFVVFEDGKIKSILQGGIKKELTISKVKVFFELNEIGD